MHDNATLHISSLVVDWLDREGIEVLLWPTQSPYLSSIKHVWDMFQRRDTPDMGHVHKATDIQQSELLQQH